MFRVGDKVKCIDDGQHIGFKHKTLILGDIYTVVRVLDNQIKLQEEPQQYFWNDKRFVLATDSGEFSANIDYFSITKDIVGG